MTIFRHSLLFDICCFKGCGTQYSKANSSCPRHMYLLLKLQLYQQPKCTSVCENNLVQAIFQCQTCDRVSELLFSLTIFNSFPDISRIYSIFRDSQSYFNGSKPVSLRILGIFCMQYAKDNSTQDELRTMRNQIPMLKSENSEHFSWVVLQYANKYGNRILSILKYFYNILNQQIEDLVKGASSS